MAHWKSIGPGAAEDPCNKNLGKWAGRIISFAQDWFEPRMLYLGAASGGVWRSVDSGQSWEPVFDELPHPSVSTIAVPLTGRNEVWIGTGDQSNGFTGTSVPRYQSQPTSG